MCKKKGEEEGLPGGCGGTRRGERVRRGWFSCMFRWLIFIWPTWWWSRSVWMWVGSDARVWKRCSALIVCQIYVFLTLVFSIGRLWLAVRHQASLSLSLSAVASSHFHILSLLVSSFPSTPSLPSLKNESCRKTIPQLKWQLKCSSMSVIRWPMRSI